MTDDRWLQHAPADSLCVGRVELERWSTDHVEELVAAVSSSLDHLAPWMPWARDYEPASTEEAVARSRDAWDTREEFTFVVRVDGEVVGACGLHARIGAGRLEIGYWVRADRTGQGIARRAASALVAAAFTLPEVEAVEIRHHPDNVRSGRIPDALGFAHLGVLPIGSTDELDGREETSVWELTREGYDDGLGRVDP